MNKMMHAVGGTIMGGQTDIEPERNSVQTIVAVKRTGGEWHMTGSPAYVSKTYKITMIAALFQYS